MKHTMYTVVDTGSGLILAARGSAGKAFVRRDEYRSESVVVLVSQLTTEQLLAIERAEATRGPVAYAQGLVS